jgi:hypothetical protein
MMSFIICTLHQILGRSNQIKLVGHVVRMEETRTHKKICHQKFLMYNVDGEDFGLM